MNKKVVLISILFFIIGFSIGGYMILNKLFPKARDINIPSVSSVLSMTVTKSVQSEEGETRKISLNDIDDIISKLSCAEPTRKMSVQDSPSARQYYRIIVDTSERTHYYYIYFEDGTCYVESPYEGVYIIDDGVLKTLPTGDYRYDDQVMVVTNEADVDTEQIKFHYENGGIIVVNNWQLSDDVQTIVRESLLVECDEKNLATVLCKSKSGAPYTGVIQGNTKDLESEIDDMVAHAKEVQ